MEDSISSGSDGPTVASILGIKGSLRFRPHGSSQKAHVVLRRVEISDNSSEDGDSKPVVYYSLFAQKRIEVKPGKEILLAVPSPDGTFKDQAVIFEGDLPAEHESSDEDETHATEEEDDAGLPPLRDVMPPKMRRAWGKRLEKVSPITNGALIPPRPHTSIGIQVQPTWVSESIQASTSHVSVSVQARPEYSSTSMLEQPLLVSSSDSSQPASLVASATCASLNTKTQIGEIFIQADYNTQINDELDELLSDIESWEGERSLSPMDLDSAASTPPQSPALVVTKLLQIDSGTDTNGVASSPASSIASSSNEPVPMLTPPPPSVTDIMDMHKAVEGAVVPTLPLESIQSESVAKSCASTPPRTPKPDMLQSRAISEMKSDQAPSAHKSVVRNPFVSAGFINEFVGATNRQTSPSSNTNISTDVDRNCTYLADNRQEAVVTEQLVSIMTESPSRLEGPSLHNLTFPQNAVASSSKVITAVPSKVKSSATSRRAREKSPTGGYPVKQQASQLATPSLLKRCSSQGLHERLSPPDPKLLVHISQGPIANPLNIKPSSNGLRKSAHFLPTIAPIIASAPSAAKRRVVVGSGWPRVRQSNGATSGAIGNPTIQSTKTQVQIPLSITSPESPSLSYTRGAATDASSSPDISKIVSYTSPSPPPSSQLMHSTCTVKMINGRPTLSIPYLDHSTRVETIPHNVFIQDLVTPSTSSQEPYKSPITEGDHSLPPHSITGQKSVLPTNSLDYRGSTPIAPKGANPTKTVSQFRVTINHPPTPKADIVGSSYRLGSKGLKRGASSSSQDLEALRPLRQRRRVFRWPTIDNLHSVALKGEGDLGIRDIAFNSDGSQFALSCFDRTIRIWNNYNHTEIARLTQYSHVVSVAWIDGDSGIVSLADDGMVSKWTRSGQNHWQWAKLLDAGNDRRQDDECICFAYSHDRIAVAFPRLGVKVWLWVKGTWHPQRSILRQNVTSIKFVEDGEALLGGTRDGVLWYCQVPNGTLRAYTFLKSKVYCIDVNASESHALVAQTGGRSHLVGIRQDDHKGKIEQAYAIKDNDSYQASYEFGAVFASRGQTVLFGDMDGCVLVWDKNKGGIVSGLDHGKEDVIQAVASFDGSPSSKDGYLITGTKQGQLTWWAQPRLDDL